MWNLNAPQIDRYIYKYIYCCWILVNAHALCEPTMDLTTCALWHPNGPTCFMFRMCNAYTRDRRNRRFVKMCSHCFISTDFRLNVHPTRIHLYHFVLHFLHFFRYFCSVISLWCSFLIWNVCNRNRIRTHTHNFIGCILCATYILAGNSKRKLVYIACTRLSIVDCTNKIQSSKSYTVDTQLKSFFLNSRIYDGLWKIKLHNRIEHTIPTNKQIQCIFCITDGSNHITYNDKCMTYVCIEVDRWNLNHESCSQYHSLSVRRIFKRERGGERLEFP